MQNDIFNLIRASLLAVIIFAIIALCAVEAGSMETIPEAPEVSEVEPTITAEVPTPTSTPSPTAKPTPSATPAPTPEPIEEWRSLGIYTLTAYCSCEICCGHWGANRPTDEHGNPIVYTATGAIAQAGTTIAVDPSVIPYGSQIKINDLIYIAQDTGGAIGGARIDIYFEDHQEARLFGVQTAEAFIKTTYQ